jgi:4-hydroxybenzoate polyprenyltransferase
MALNDLCDVEQDARERPFRPLPSGAISTRSARILVVLLFAAGLSAAVLAGPAAGTCAAVLALLIVLYDCRLKRTRLGPIGMGACRFVNVLLGIAPASLETAPFGLRLHLAGVVGLYAAAITWFARTEALGGRPGELRASAGLGLLALVAALPAPLHRDPGSASPIFPYLLAALIGVVGSPAIAAIRRPEPRQVQRAVKTAVLAIIALDAALATAISGNVGLLILLLLLPAIGLGRRIYST